MRTSPSITVSSTTSSKCSGTTNVRVADLNVLPQTTGQRLLIMGERGSEFIQLNAAASGNQTHI